MWKAVSYYAALALESALGVFGVRLYEEPPYQVIDRIGDRIEIRRYAARLVAEVEVSKPGEAGRSEAFGLLFNYIAGANSTADATPERIAMTVPVASSVPERLAMTMPVPTQASGEGVRMQFFLPAAYRIDTAPRPNDPAVRLKVVPEATLAALRYSGSVRTSGERRAELIAQLSQTAWRPSGAAFDQFYDAPFTLPPLRRNEAVVAVIPAG